jgi:hypothetical protein
MFLGRATEYVFSLNNIRINKQQAMSLSFLAVIAPDNIIYHYSISWKLYFKLHVEH